MTPAQFSEWAALDTSGLYDSRVNPADMSIPEPCYGENWLGEVGITTTGIAVEETDAGAEPPTIGLSVQVVPA